MSRVVIVDDAPFIREVLTHLLKKFGFEVVGEASDGEEGVQTVLTLKPELVIMDIVMPRKSGIQATVEILQQLPNTRIVACSTEGSETMVTKALEAGCCDFVVKPFDQTKLLNSLNAALKGVK